MASTPDTTAAVPREPLWRQKANAFWRWWSAELLQLVPERFALHGAERTPLLSMDGERLVLVDPRPGASEQSADLAGLDPARRKAAVRGLLERAGETKMRARAVLGPQEALVRRVTLPAAAGENLRQVLGFEMDRLTPFRAEEVYFDHRLVSRDAGAGQLALQLAVARREVVDARVEALRALGVSVQGVTLREQPGQGPAAFDLLPSEQRGERDSPRERLLRRGLAIAVVVLLAAALLLPLVQKRSSWLALNPQVEAAREKAETASALSTELDRQVADYNFLLTRKLGSYPALAVVEEVTRLLPDNTWVQQMDIRTVGKTREVQIVGETASASKLIEILEGSTLLQNAAFRGTVTRGSQPNTERFMIAAEIRPRALPEPRPVLEVASAIATPPPARAAAPSSETGAATRSEPTGETQPAASPTEAPSRPSAMPVFPDRPPAGSLNPTPPRQSSPPVQRPLKSVFEVGPDGKMHFKGGAVPPAPQQPRQGAQ